MTDTRTGRIRFKGRFNAMIMYRNQQEYALMETLRFKTHIGSDGVLKIEAPVGIADVDAEVVLVYSVQRPIQDDDWAAFVNATYGILADDPIERPEELPADVRDWLE
jgi:hypothetical protein